MECATDSFEGFEVYAEGVTEEKLGFYAFVDDTVTKLRELRFTAGLTLKKAAERYGCTPQALCKMVSGDYDIRVGTLWKYATALGYQVQIDFVPKQEEI